MLKLPILLDAFTSSDGYVTEDLIDQLNSQVTAYLLFFLAMIVGGKQNFGTPLQCMAPAESVDSWVDYYHDYCFVHNDLKADVNKDGKPNPAIMIQDAFGEKVLPAKPVYYQWVPYILFVQAILFLVPRKFWKFVGTNFRGTDIDSVVVEAAKIQKMMGESREKATKTLATFVGETLDVRARKKRSPFTLSLCYVLRKWFMLFNVVFQFVLLTNLIAASDDVVDFLWGWKLLEKAVFPTPNTTTSEFFPNVIRCNIDRYEVGNNRNTNSIQCVLMMNFINEKIFLLIYFWLIALAFINLLAAVRFTMFLTVEIYRNHVARALLPCHETLMEKTSEDMEWLRKHIEGRKLFEYFLSVIGTDGILMLIFVYNYAGGMITAELTQELWNIAFPPLYLKRTEPPAEPEAKSDRFDAGAGRLLDDNSGNASEDIYDDNVKKLEKFLKPEDR